MSDSELPQATKFCKLCVAFPVFGTSEATDFKFGTLVDHGSPGITTHSQMGVVRVT